jgi:hypothetical protein
LSENNQRSTGQAASDVAEPFDKVRWRKIEWFTRTILAPFDSRALRIHFDRANGLGMREFGKHQMLPTLPIDEMRLPILRIVLQKDVCVVICKKPTPYGWKSVKQAK